MNPITCAECIHFRRDDINPPAGLGFCPLRKVVQYPDAPHYCKQHEEPEEDRETQNY